MPQNRPLYISTDLHRQIKSIAVQRGLTLSSLAEKVLADWIQRNSAQPDPVQLRIDFADVFEK